MANILVSLSGGMDSATVLGLARDSRMASDVKAVGFTYGSKHNLYENLSAEALAIRYGVDFELIDLTEVMSSFKSNLLKTGGDIPEGHYESASMSQTVVPGRNIIFTAILAGYAWSHGCKQIWLGIHAGDHAIYPDCRPEFYAYMDSAIRSGTGEKVAVYAPFLIGNKITILKRGLELEVPYQLTRTCYKDQEYACGKCGACQERLEAFAANNTVDPIKYDTREIMEKVSD